MCSSVRVKYSIDADAHKTEENAGFAWIMDKLMHIFGELMRKTETQINTKLTRSPHLLHPCVARTHTRVFLFFFFFAALTNQMRFPGVHLGATILGSQFLHEVIVIFNFNFLAFCAHSIIAAPVFHSTFYFDFNSDVDFIVEEWEREKRSGAPIKPCCFANYLIVESPTNAFCTKDSVFLFLNFNLKHIFSAFLIANASVLWLDDFQQS